MKNESYLTTDDLTIYSYIVEKDPTMSMFLDIADKVKFGGTLQAYGRYTCFIPSNDGVKTYLNSLGKSSVTDLTEEECFTILKYHIISMPEGVDSLTSANFVDGRLPIPNMLAKYLTVRTVTENGKIFTEVNRQALIINEDIRTANGYIQKIDHVLIPPSLTVGEQIMALPDNFSLYKQVMNQTGWIDSLSSNKDNNVWFTAFVQSNETFASMGINNKDDLLEILRIKRSDIADHPRGPSTMTKEDSLFWSFAAYQVVNDLNYVVDLTRTTALITCSPNQAITFKMEKDEILLNEFADSKGDIVEFGAPVNRMSEYTDLSCYNGVLLEIGINPQRTEYIGPMVRKATAVYWDVCAQPEWKKHPNYTRGAIPRIPTTELSEIWAYNAQGEEIDAARFRYTYNTNQSDDKWQVVNHDYITYFARDFAYIDFKMPLLIEGTYNLWACTRRDPDPTQVRIQFAILEEGQPDQLLKARDLYFQYSDRVKSIEDMVNYGAKRYVARVKRNESFALECGMFDVKSTGRHILRMIVINQGITDANSFLDMFHFIPFDQDQYWPRFDQTGRMCWPDTPCTDIFPYASTGCNNGNT